MATKDRWEEGEVRFVATAVDHGEGADGKADVLGVFKTREGAERCVRQDMADYEGRVDERGGREDIIFDYDELNAYRYPDTKVCEWGVAETREMTLAERGDW